MQHLSCIPNAAPIGSHIYDFLFNFPLPSWLLSVQDKSAVQAVRVLAEIALLARLRFTMTNNIRCVTLGHRTGSKTVMAQTWITNLTPNLYILLHPDNSLITPPSRG